MHRSPKSTIWASQIKAEQFTGIAITVIKSYAPPQIIKHLTCFQPNHEMFAVNTLFIFSYSSIGLVFCCFGPLGTLELSLKFYTFIFHKLSRQSPPLQVVNGEWMTSSTVTKSPKSESETRKRESGVLLPTFKMSRDKDDFKNYSGSSGFCRFCPPLLLHRPQVPPYWGQTTSSSPQ